MRTARSLGALAFISAACSMIGACSSEPPTARLETGANDPAGARIEFVQEVDPRSLILIDARNPRLEVGFGLIMRARIVDASGATVVGARPTWRSSQPGIATTTPLPDSVGADGTRVAVGAHALGDALIIATYNSLADTARLKVVSKADTVAPPPPPTPPYVRPTKFDATIIVRGFVSAADSATNGTQLIPGTVVTLTRLPSLPGDSLPPGVTSVTTPTLFGTQTVNANSQVTFVDVPQSRFRVEVVPPSSTTWQRTEFTYPPPQVATYTRTVTLHRP